MLLPKEGGPLFVPFCGSDVVSQADINAAFNIGLRAVAHPAMLTIHNRIRVRKSKNGLIPVRNSNLAKMVFSRHLFWTGVNNYVTINRSKITRGDAHAL